MLPEYRFVLYNYTAFYFSCQYDTIKLQNFIHSNATQASCNTEIQKIILADDRSFDIYNATEWSGSKLVTEKLYLNIADAPYMSLDSDWWDRDYMAEMSVGRISTRKHITDFIFSDTILIDYLCGVCYNNIIIFDNINPLFLGGTQ